MSMWLYRAGIGILAGVICGLVAFESVLVLYIGLGQYSLGALRQGAVIGVISGVVFGPLFAVFRTPMVRAALWEAGVLVSAQLAFEVWAASVGTVYSSAQDAFITILGAISFDILAGALAGASTAWLVDRLATHVQEYQASRGPAGTSTRSSNQAERRYRL